MKQLLISIAAVLVVGCAKPPPPDISIHSATKNGNIKAVKQHLAAGTDVNAKEEDLLGWTPLHYTATSGNRQITKLLISKGANVNAINSYNYTPLHGATCNGHKEIAELLIANGADVNARDNGGKTPLDETMLDLSLNKKELADLLRKYGGKTGFQLQSSGN